MTYSCQSLISCWKWETHPWRHVKKKVHSISTCLMTKKLSKEFKIPCILIIFRADLASVNAGWKYYIQLVFSHIFCAKCHEYITLKTMHVLIKCTTVYCFGCGVWQKIGLYVISVKMTNHASLYQETLFVAIVWREFVLICFMHITQM